MFILYRITTTASHKCYIGQHSGNMSLEKYFKRNLLAAQSGRSDKPYLYNAIRKHGAESFSIETLKVLSNKKELNESEVEAIKTYKSCNTKFGYNIDRSGNHSGHPMSSDTKEKIRQTLKDRKPKPLTEAGRRKISEAMSKRIVSQETRDKISKSLTGRIQSLSTRIKRSRSMKGNPNLAFWKGKTFSQETRMKMSLGQKKLIEEEKAKGISRQLRLKDSYRRVYTLREK